MRRYWIVVALAFSAAPPLFGEEAKGPLDGLKYRLIGPAQGGRISRVTGIPGDPQTYYAATAAGGVWKSSNGGSEWSALFDEQPISSIGSIAVAASDPNVVWVGSGEANIRGNVAEGDGIYVSTDAGKNWKHVWTAEGQIGTIVVHPGDPGSVYAAALGSPFGPSEERGVYRTEDGGATWERVLFVDVDTGAIDVCLDPSNPRILYAAFWQARRTPWGMTSGGDGSGLWASRDGGDTWKQLERHGLPDGAWGRVGVRVASTGRVYALIEAEEGGLFRSDDGGKKWSRVNGSRGLRQRAWYYSTLTVDPTRPDTVWFPQVTMLQTRDGGTSVRSVQGGGWDYHDVWIDPVDPNRMIVGSDAGVSLSRDGGESWVKPPLPISQFYHLSVDTRRPYHVLGSLQDWGTVSGPSNSLHGDGILLGDWHGVGGGEAGHVVADPDDPQIVWAGEYLGIITRWDGRTRRATHVGAYAYDGSGHGAEDLRYRFQWTAPIVVSPHDSKTVYHAANVLFRTRDGGQSWHAISPDLTHDDVSKQLWAGGPITGDNTGVEYYGTIFAVAESPVAQGVIWAGTDDGRAHVTRDAGETWQEITPGALPAWATVSCIEASSADPGTAYLVADAHRLDDETPYLWKTEDFGASWRDLTAELDDDVYLHTVRHDPSVPGMLYLGSERGVRVSRDDGENWESLQLNMPTVSVVDLAVAGDDLVVATLGRSAWILDDLTPVREMSAQIQGSAAHLFSPRPAVAWRYGTPPDGSRDGAGKNPPQGAILTYKLAVRAESEAAPEIGLEIRSSAGELVRRLSSVTKAPYVSAEHPDRDPRSKDEPALTAEAGINRAVWDLRYEGPDRVPGAMLDWGDPGAGSFVLPGEYELRLSVGEETFSERLIVEEDPRLEASASDRAAQVAFTREASALFARVTEHVLAIRAVREQIIGRNERLEGREDVADLIALGSALAADLDTVEAELHNPQAEVGYDILAGRGGGARLHSQLGWLFLIGREHDGSPTQGMREMAKELKHELAVLEERLNHSLGTKLGELEILARERGIPHIIR